MRWRTILWSLAEFFRAQITNNHKSRANFYSFGMFAAFYVWFLIICFCKCRRRGYRHPVVRSMGGFCACSWSHHRTTRTNNPRRADCAHHKEIRGVANQQNSRGNSAEVHEVPRCPRFGVHSGLWGQSKKRERAPEAHGNVWRGDSKHRYVRVLSYLFFCHGMRTLWVCLETAVSSAFYWILPSRNCPLPPALRAGEGITTIDQRKHKRRPYVRILHATLPIVLVACVQGVSCACRKFLSVYKTYASSCVQCVLFCFFCQPHANIAV